MPVLRFSRVFVLLLAMVLPAQAQRITLRVATAAPDGTGWARLIRTMAREIFDESKGEIASKLYFGGVAGDEMQTWSRLERDQLDIVLSGGMLCTKLSPSLRVLRLLGLFQSREESAYVFGRLRPFIDNEFAQHGMHHVAAASLGADMLLTRHPVTSMADLRRTRIWVWNLDETMLAEMKELGIPAVPLPVNEAARAYDEGKIDGFLTVPSAALAFQWSSQAHYLVSLTLGHLPSCMVLTNRVWDAMSVQDRQTLVNATARFQARVEQVGRSTDEALLGGLFARQGVKMVPASAAFTADFFEAAVRARASIRDKLIPAALMEKVTGWLADFRAEFGRPRK